MPKSLNSFLGAGERYVYKFVCDPELVGSSPDMLKPRFHDGRAHKEPSEPHQSPPQTWHARPNIAGTQEYAPFPVYSTDYATPIALEGC